MGIFLIISTLTTLLIVYVVVRPMARNNVERLDDNEQLRISIYRENLQELESEFSTGQLGKGQLDNVKNELEMSLLQESGNTISNNNLGLLADSRSHFSMSIIVGLILIGLSILIYAQLGNPQLIALKKFGDINVEETWENNPSKENMISLMKTHLQRNPDDANGIYFLANVYVADTDYNNAVLMFEKLHEFAGDNTQVLLAHIDTLIRANEGSFAGRAEEIIHQVLSIEPENYTALLFAGLAAEESGNYQGANSFYAKILPILQNQPKLLQTVNMLIAQNTIMMQEAGIDPVTPESPTDTLVDPTKSVQLRIDVLPGLVDQFSENDTLFIYAQVTEGRPMPLAVIRTQANMFPMEVTLDDTQAMMPTHKISDFEIVRVQARISKTGAAEPTSGDILGVLEKVTVADTNRVELVINEIIP
ncbi:MAG: c-type cytochrome biogenesis protein CcmI [Gammaproteobacteria bacterium]|jgi:cytochrome c-type biogenesis protein CcmH